MLSANEDVIMKDLDEEEDEEDQIASDLNGMFVTPSGAFFGSILQKKVTMMMTVRRRRRQKTKTHLSHH